MKQKLIVSSILLAGAGCSAEAGDLADAQQEAVEVRADLVDMRFMSHEVFRVRRTRWDEATRAAKTEELDVRLRLELIPAADYELDGAASGLDYEVVVTEIVEGTGEIIPSNWTYYAKRTGPVEHEIFDCDSTRRCSSDRNKATMSIYDDSVRGGKGLKLRQDEDFSIAPRDGEIVFASVEK